jgi:pilus assembly protein CpaB
MVPLPTGDLAAGTVITAQHIGRGPWTVDELSGDTLLSASVIIGRVVKNDIPAAEPIHGRDLYAPGVLPKLPLSDGTRGVTIQIKEPALLMEGWLKPGSHVDILFSLTEMLDDPRVRRLGGMSMTLFKGVRILAINRDIVQAPLEDTMNSVTLEINEEDVNILRSLREK